MDGRESTYLHGSSPDEQQRLSQMNSWINPESLRLLRLQRGLRVLDVGCGLGQFSRAMARAVQPDGRVVGVERDPEQLEGARRQALAAGEGDLVDFRQGDASALPLTAGEAGAFDLAHARFLLEHLKDPSKAVKEMCRVVKLGGRVILIDDDHDRMRFHPEPGEFLPLWLAYLETYRILGNDPTVGRRLTSLLREAGSTPIRTGLIPYTYCSGGPGFSEAVANIDGLFMGVRRLLAQHNLLSEAEFQRRREAFQKWSRLPDAVIWYDVPLAEGRK